jgi:hypothetical protein
MVTACYDLGPMTRRREAALLVTLAVVTTVVLTYPLAFQLGTGGRVDSLDGLFSIWNIAWVARTVVADPAGLFDANIFYPHLNALAFSEANLVAGLLAVPPYWLTRNPYFAHNTVVLLSFMLSLVGTYLLVRHLTGSRAAAAVSGVLFAFCPFIFARTPHIQLMMTAGLPFSMLAFHRLVERPGIARGVSLGLVLAATALACGYYGLFAGLIVGVAILFHSITDQRWRDSRYWIGIGVAVAVGGLVAGLGFLPYLEVAETHGSIARTLDEARTYSSDWRAYLASPARSHRWLLDLIEVWPEVNFPGFLSLGLAGVGLVAVWRPTPGGTISDVQSASPDARERQVVALYGLIGFLAVWGSLGPAGGLYTLLFETVPGFAMLRAPARLGIVVALALAVLAGVGTTRLARGRRTGWVTAILILVAMVELAAVPYPHHDAPKFPAAYRMLAKLPVGPVAEFPYFSGRVRFNRHTYYMVGSTTHWLPLVNGYSDVIPRDFRDEVEALAKFPTREAFEILDRHETRYVVLHRNLYDERNWAALVDRLRAFPERLVPIFYDEDGWLFEIVTPRTP